MMVKTFEQIIKLNNLNCMHKEIKLYQNAVNRYYYAINLKIVVYDILTTYCYVRQQNMNYNNKLLQQTF